MIRIAFLGTPEFAVPSLDALVNAGYEIAGVFTQPDRPAGRGHKLVACPVKVRALEHGLNVYQFEKLRGEEGVKTLKSLDIDFMITAAFGQILNAELLSIPKRGTMNVHASLLPKHRGSAPINRCILQGDKKAGITIMLTDVGIDTGDMLLQRETDIGEMETAGELAERLSKIGAELLVEALKKYASGEIQPIPQDASKATYEPMLNKEMAKIDWTKSAVEISRTVRGLNPWPCAETAFQGGRLKIYMAKPSDCACDAQPGTAIVANAKEGLVVACGEGALELIEIQAPAAKRMTAKAYLSGKKIEIGTHFGRDEE